jgi:hypothetical protein
MHQCQGWRIGCFKVADMDAALLLPGAASDTPPALPVDSFLEAMVDASLIDLCRGSVVDAHIARTREGCIGVEPQPSPDSPSLLIGKRCAP